MNIALVLPPAERVAEKKDTPKYQHIGLGYIAAMLEKEGMNVAVINAKLERLNYNQALNRVLDSKPDIVGITAMTHEINMAGRIAEAVKKASPHINTIIGGVHVTALPKETLSEYKAFDLGIQGEGEYVFLEIVRRLRNKTRYFGSLKGAVYRGDSGIMLSQPMERIVDLDNLPFPAWHFFPAASEYIIITGRGCPFSCIFCMQALGRVVRKRSPENVVAEVELVLSKRKPDRFLFYDETFTLDKNRVYEICDLLIKRGLNKKINWAVTTRVDSVSRDILIKMKEAGCNHIEFGVESGDSDVLENIQKKITLEQARTALALAKELGFHTEGAFILGHPNETLKTAYKTISFAAMLNPDIIQLGIMVPYPGTEVANLARQGKGGYRLISKNWSDYNKQLGNALELDNLSRKDLERLQLTGYLKLFIANRRFLDFFSFVWNYRMEFLSFIRNHLKKDKIKKASRIGIGLMTKMIFTDTANLNDEI